MRSVLQTWSATDYIKQDRIHRSVYTDPVIFALEMERIFKRTWLFVGHESQIPKPGDFVTLTLAGEPVVMVRHRDGKPYVLYNRCGHRGAIVCNQGSGNAKVFRCCYHGWVFKTNGDIQSIPLKNGYDENFDATDPDIGMKRLHRVESYRGFVFANMANSGPSLEDHLGPIRHLFDEMADRSPDGELLVTGGVHRYQFRGNWKEQIENLNDLYHPPYSHESTTNSDGRQFQRRAGDDGGFRFSDKGEPMSFWDQTGVWAFDNGHSFCGRLNAPEKRGGVAYEEYVRSLELRHGKERTAQLLDPHWHNAIIYPNLCIQALSQHIRVVVPVRADLTEVHVYPILLKGAPDELNQAVIRYLNVTHSAASLIQTDDLEAFRRIQRGLDASKGSAWILFARGLKNDRPTENGWTGDGTSELPMRNQYRAWLNYMQPEFADVED